MNHSPLARTAALPRASGLSPPNSTLRTSSAQYFSPESSNLPCLHSATRSAAISCVVMLDHLPWEETPTPRPSYQGFVTAFSRQSRQHVPDKPRRVERRLAGGVEAAADDDHPAGRHDEHILPPVALHGVGSGRQALAFA